MYDDPVATEAAFYEAFRNLDHEGMRRVWKDAVDTSCIHPGGHLIRGTGDILASWRGIFRGSELSGFAYRLLAANADGGLAVHTVEEDISSPNGHGAIVLATNVYGRFADGWRMLAHHASLPLVESDDTHGRGPLH